MGSCHCHITGYLANYPFLDQLAYVAHGKQPMVNDAVNSFTLKLTPHIPPYFKQCHRRLACFS